MTDKKIITDEECIRVYSKHMHLKNAAEEIGMKWQTLYVRLKKNGVNVVGDKSKYGSLSDKVGAKGEHLFLKLVPSAIDENKESFQAAIDFTIYGWGVDVKASLRKFYDKKQVAQRWAFSIKKQESICDFFVMIGFCDKGEKVEAIFLIPAEILRHSQSISISTTGKSKWMDYKISGDDLFEFFEEVGAK